MVRELFGVTPDAWQHEALEAFPTNPRIAMKACAGPGKTALLAWIGWNFMLTRPHPKIGCTSISGQNLKANLWAELANWQERSPLLMAQFARTATEYYHREHRATWKIEARTWAQDANPEQVGNALRGLHADYVMWLLDESGAYPDAILPVAENIFSGSPKEAHIVQAGNPTHLTGALYHACIKAKDLWHVITITGDPDDPKRSPRISLEHARAQIKQYGRENPWVMVNILGQFPPSSLNALIGVTEVESAMSRMYRDHDIERSPRILGVDVAREGDDRSVIFPRQGLVAFKPHIMRNANSVQGAGQVARTWTDWQVDTVFIDNTGGFGAGWIDQLMLLRRNAIGIGFAERAEEGEKYANRRAEMYFRMAEWIKSGGCLPDVPDLTGELIETTYTFQGDRLLLEPKAVIKKRLGRSPDLSDALALTFAADVAPRHVGPVIPRSREREREYNPFAGYLN